MYVENIYNHFHDFRRPLNCVAMKFEIVIENSQFETPPNMTSQREYSLRPLHPLHQTDNEQGTPNTNGFWGGV